MKKLTTATDLGGAPIYKNDLREVFNGETWAVIEALLSSYNADVQGIVVSGCVTTANGGNFDMTAGIVYLNGEFMRITAATNQPFTKYIAPKAVINDTRTFLDTTTHIVTIDKQAELVGSAPGSGQYLSIASLTDLDDRRWKPALLQYVDAADNLKANKAQSSWVNITLINGWSISGLSTPQYRIDQFGQIHLRGRLDGTTSTGLTFTNSLPSNASQIFFNVQRRNSGVQQLGAITITTGQGSSIFTVGDDVIYLDNLSYWVD